MRMRWLKITGIVLAALVGVVILAASAVLLWVNPNDYRGDIERLAEQKTGRSLKIGGRLDLKLFPYLAISIADVRLGNPSAYGTEPFATIHQASVGVRLLPILRRRLEVSRVSVDGLTASLVSRSATDNNWSDLTESKGNAAQGRGSGSTQATIAGVQITNSSLQYRDEATKSVTSLSNLRLQTGVVGGTEPMRLALEFDYGNGGARPAAHIAVVTRVEMPPGSARVALDDLDVHGNWFGDAPQATPLPFSLRSNAVALDMKSQALAPATFDVKAGDLSAHLSATGQRLFTDRLIAGKLTVPRVSPRKVLESLGVKLPATRDARALSTLSLSSDFRLTPTQLRLDNLDLTLDETHVRGAAAVEDLNTMALSYDLKVDDIDVDRYLSPQPSAPAKSSPQPTDGAQNPPVSVPVAALRKLDVHGALQIGHAIVGGIAVSGASVPLAAKEGRVRLGPTQARLLGGTYNGDIVLDAAPAQAQLSLNEHVKGVDAGELMKSALKTTRISGRGDANVVVTGVGNTDADILRSLAGKIDVNVKGGAVNGIDLWYELRRARALVKREAIPARSGPERTPFNTFSGSGNLIRGVVHNDDLSIETDYLRAHGKGTLDLGTKVIDYSIVASVYNLPPEGAGSEMKDLKAADIPFLITGSLASMQVRPDLEGLAKAQVRQEVNKKVQEKSDELKKKLGDKLKDLFGH